MSKQISPRQRKSKIPGIPRRPRKQDEPWIVSAVGAVLPGFYLLGTIALGIVVGAILTEITGLENLYLVVTGLAIIIAIFTQERATNAIMGILY